MLWRVKEHYFSNYRAPLQRMCFRTPLGISLENGNVAIEGDIPFVSCHFGCNLGSVQGVLSRNVVLYNPLEKY